MQLALNELDFQIKCIYNRSSIISSYDLPLTTNIKISQVCHNGSSKFLITSQVSQADMTLRVCYVKRGRGLVMDIFSQESRCRVTSDCSDGKYNVLRSANAKYH